MIGKHAFLHCVCCGKWAWKRRLIKQQGACAVCGTVLHGWTTSENGTWHQRWAVDSVSWPKLGPKGCGAGGCGKASPPPAVDAVMVNASAPAGLESDPEAAHLAIPFKSLAASKRTAPPPKPAHAVLKEATTECSRKQEALHSAARSAERATLQLERARWAFTKASDEMVETECQRLQALKAAGTCVNDKDAACFLKVDRELFESLDELEPADKRALETVQKQLEGVARQANEKQKEFQVLLGQARPARKEAATKRRRRDEGGAAVRGDGDPASLASGAAVASPGGSASRAAAGESDRMQWQLAGGVVKSAAEDSSLDVFFGKITERGPQAARCLVQQQERRVA
ncbi:unnamed protein product, partial [Prorocentrum cordatum]